MHLINWKQICQPLNNRGLGIKDISAMIDALLMKLAYGLITETDSLWVQVLRGKYKARKELMPTVNFRHNPSPIWHRICKLWEKVYECSRWIIGNGSQIRVWDDKWLEGEGPLIDKVRKDIPDHLRNAKIKDTVDSNGNWNWELFQDLLPSSSLVKIVTVLPP